MCFITICYFKRKRKHKSKSKRGKVHTEHNPLQFKSEVAYKCYCVKNGIKPKLETKEN